MRYKAHVEIKFNIPKNETLLTDPDDFLEGMLSQMDEVGHCDVEHIVYSIKPIGGDVTE